MALNRLEMNQQEQKAFFDARFEPQGNFIDCKNVRVQCDDECKEDDELSRADVQNRGIRTRKVCGTTVVIDSCNDESKDGSDKKINLNEINIQLEGSNIFEKLKDFPRIFDDSSSNLGVTFKCEKHGSCMSTKETDVTVNVKTSKPKQTVCPKVELMVETVSCSDKENEDPRSCPKLCVRKVECKPCKKETLEKCPKEIPEKSPKETPEKSPKENPEKSPKESPKDSPKFRVSLDSNKLKDDLEQFRNSQKKEEPEPPKSPKKISIDLCKPKKIQEPPKPNKKSLESGQQKLEEQDYKIVELNKPKQKNNELVPAKKPRKLCKVRCCGVMVVIAEDKHCGRKAHCCSKKRRKCCCDCRCCSPRNEKRAANDLKEDPKREGSVRKRLSGSIRKRLSGSTRRKRGGSYGGRRDTRPDDDDASDYSEFSEARISRKPSRRTKKSKFSFFSDNASDNASDNGTVKRRNKKSKFSLFQSDESYESEDNPRNGRHKRSGVSTIQTNDTDDNQSERKISKSSEKSRGTTTYDASEESRGTNRKSIPRKRFSFFKSDETDYKSDYNSDGRKSGIKKKSSFYRSDETDKSNGAMGVKRRSILKTDASDFEDRRRRISKSDPFPSQDDDEDEAPKIIKRPSMFSRMKSVLKKK